MRTSVGMGHLGTASAVVAERVGELTPERETRRHGDPAWMATVLANDQVVGRFTVQNLTASGALLTGAHDVDPDARLTLFLELREGTPLELSARVVRRAAAGPLVALAVRFDSIPAAAEDRIQEVVLRALDRQHRLRHPAVIVVDADPTARALLADAIRDAGLRPVVYAAPLEALRTLEDPDDRVTAVLVRDAGDESGRALLTWVSDAHPAVRAMLMVEDERRDPPASRGTCRVSPATLAAELRRSA